MNAEREGWVRNGEVRAMPLGQEKPQSVHIASPEWTYPLAHWQWVYALHSFMWFLVAVCSTLIFIFLLYQPLPLSPGILFRALLHFFTAKPYFQGQREGTQPCGQKGEVGLLWHSLMGRPLLWACTHSWSSACSLVCSVVCLFWWKLGKSCKLIPDSIPQVRNGIQTQDGCLESSSWHLDHCSNSPQGHISQILSSSRFILKRASLYICSFLRSVLASS